MSEVTISSGKLWTGLGTVSALVVYLGWTHLNDRDLRHELVDEKHAEKIQKIEDQRAATLEKYLETKEAEKRAAEEKPDLAKKRELVLDGILGRLEALEGKSPD